MKILGVDPGIHGGLAIVELTYTAIKEYKNQMDYIAEVIDAVDIPVIGTAAKERVDVAAIGDWSKQWVLDHAFIERAQAMPQQGASSGFKYGRAVGALEAMITLAEIPMTIIEASMWKKFYRLPGKDKEAARQRAMQLFPMAHAYFARKKDHGRAEAVLIAMYGASINGGAK